VIQACLGIWISGAVAFSSGLLGKSSLLVRLDLGTKKNLFPAINEPQMMKIMYLPFPL
jgi:hypothetical protein